MNDEHRSPAGPRSVIEVLSANRGDTSTSDDRRGQDRAEWAILVAVLLLISVLVILPAYQERDAIVGRERDRLNAAAQVMERDLVRMLEGADRAILNVRSQLAGWQQHAGGMAQATVQLKAFADAMPGVRSMLLLNAAGESLAIGASDRVDVPAHIDAADTEAFRVARRVANPNLLFVSAPYRTKGGAWTFSLSRVVPAPDGSFAALVVAVIDPEELKLLLASTRMVDDQFAAVVHGGGGLIVIEPSNRGSEGDNMAQPGTFFSRHMASGQPVSILQGSSPASHWEQRIMALRTVQPPALHMDEPIVVLDGRNTDAVLAPWRRLMNSREAALAIACLFSALGLALWQRYRRRARGALSEKMRQIDRLFESPLSHLAIFDLDGRCVRVSAAWQRTMGWSNEVLVGKPLRPYAHPEDHPALDAARLALAAVGAVADFQFRVRDSAGTYHELTAQAFMRDEMIYMDARDVTEERRSKRALSSLNAQLRQINAELEAKNRQLQAQERALQELSMQDPLTGVANRRRFDEALLTEWRRGAREREPLSLVMVDIDHFKDFNDRYGHLAGDSCLKAVAAALQEGARRPHDLLARFGGEEFAVLLPNTAADGARSLAEDLRQRVEVLHIVHERSSAAAVVTLSLGIKTIVPSDDSSITELLSGADAALYAAKEQGRNRVSVAKS